VIKKTEMQNPAIKVRPMLALSLTKMSYKENPLLKPSPEAFWRWKNA
jgi:hypothetical protein